MAFWRGTGLSNAIVTSAQHNFGRTANQMYRCLAVNAAGKHVRLDNDIHQQFGGIQHCSVFPDRCATQSVLKHRIASSRLRVYLHFAVAKLALHLCASHFYSSPPKVSAADTT